MGKSSVFKLDTPTTAVIDSLAIKTGRRSRAQVVSAAVALLSVAATAEREGASLVLRHAGGETVIHV